MLSTHVEVVRDHVCCRARRGRALHARGGGPWCGCCKPQRTKCSPRTWRWSVWAHPFHVFESVLSTHVEVVQEEDLWRIRALGVLSTHVEVVRSFERGDYQDDRALHARGGGPYVRYRPEDVETCSPRTWRWSVRVLSPRCGVVVLSTHVEVVRTRAARPVGR